MVERIFATDDRLAPALTADGVRLGIIGRDPRTTEMPEYLARNLTAEPADGIHGPIDTKAELQAGIARFRGRGVHEQFPPAMTGDSPGTRART